MRSKDAGEEAGPPSAAGGELQTWLEKIAATVPGVICSFRLRPDGAISMPFATAALDAIYGLSPEQVQDDATPILSRMHPGDAGYVSETIAASARNMSEWRAEFRVCHPQRGELWVEGHSMPQREQDGSILWLGFVRDVTERKRMEAALRDSERLYRAIGELIDYGVWVCAANGRNLYASDSFLRLVGLSQESCADFGWFSVLHPDDVAPTLAAWMECVRTGATWDIEYRVRGVDGQWHHVLARGVPVRNDKGEITYWVGINLDIGRLKQVEQSLRDSEADLRRAQTVAQTGSWRLDIRRNELHWSDENHRIFGVPKGVPLTYETFLSIIHPDDRAFVDASWRAAMRGEPYDIEHRLIVDGEIRWVRERVELEFDGAGALMAGFGSTQDITARKEAEAALLRLNDTLEEKVAERTFEAEARAQAVLESERFTRATIDALSSSLCVLDAQGCIVTVNRAWREFARSNGGEPATVGEGASYLAVCEAAARSGCGMGARVAEAIRSAIAGWREDFSMEYECNSPDQRRWFALSLTCFCGAGPLRMVVVHKDITERMLAAEEQAESAKRLKRLAAHLESVREEQNARIAREVHDELGGTLTMLKLGLATAVDDLAPAMPLHGRLEQLLGQVDAALKTVKRISAGLRPAMLDALGLIATVKWYAADFSRMTGIGTEVLAPDTVRLSRLIETAVFRIIQEALTNVAKHARASRVAIVMGQHNGSLAVEVCDDGVGLADSDRNKNDSFGLIGMLERAQYLNGSLSIVGRPGEGTCLILRVPLDERLDDERSSDGDRADRG